MILHPLAIVGFLALGLALGAITTATVDRLVKTMTHDEAIAAGFLDGSDAYWIARTGEPLDLTPVSHATNPQTINR
jgi:hypothetical protein